MVVSLLHRTALVEHHADAAQMILEVIMVDWGGVIGEGDVALLGEQHRQGVAAVNGVAAVVGGVVDMGSHAVAFDGDVRMQR